MQTRRERITIYFHLTYIYGLAAGSSSRSLAGSADPGKFGGMGMRVRQCAADVLISSGVDWDILRLLYIAILKEDVTKCAIGQLNVDVVRIILRWYFQICKSI